MSGYPAMDNLFFRDFCRVPGTRTDSIMHLIELGYDDKTIATTWNTDARTIRVYRKAMECKLSKGIKALMNDNEELAQTIMAMRGADDTQEGQEKREAARLEAERRRDNRSPEALERIEASRVLLAKWERKEIKRMKLDVTDATGVSLEIVARFGGYSRAEETANISCGVLRKEISQGQLPASMIYRLALAGCDLIGAGWIAPPENEEEDE